MKPTSATGQADLSYVESVSREIARVIETPTIIVEKSTVPVGTNAWIERSLLLNFCDCSDFEVVSNPEFLREGSPVLDFLYPDRIVVGVSTDRAARIMREVYQPLIDASYAERAGAVPKPEGASISPLLAYGHSRELRSRS